MHVNVYIPDSISLKQTGYLKGFISNSSNKKNYTLIISNNVEPKISDGSIGLLNSETVQFQNDVRHWILLQTIPNLMVTKLFINGAPVDLHDHTPIIYKPYDIEESAILKNTTEPYLDPINSFVQFSQLDVTNSKKYFDEAKWTWLYIIMSILQFYYKWILLLEALFLKFDNIFKENLGTRSCFIDQILLRIKQIKYIKKSFHKSKNYLSLCRLVGIVVTDVFLGILCVYLLFSITSSSEIHAKVKSAASSLASNVQMLLLQLRGAPAGLKLNQPLTEAYAVFFSYIVHLWTIYLDRANSAMAVVSYFFMFVGLLGLSTQAALMADVFNLVSLHIYCVYVYAARIHMMQVSIVGSQWRAFCGKKWNPLKQRVDCLDEFSQRPLRKILTVFVFTVVVFLLPTTTVYYAVFVMIRLCFVCVNGLITVFIWFLNYNPVFVFVQYIIKSPKIQGEIHFEAMPTDVLRAPILPFLKMNLHPSSLTKIITISNEVSIIPPFPSPNLNRLYNSFIYAHCLF